MWTFEFWRMQCLMYSQATQWYPMCLMMKVWLIASCDVRSPDGIWKPGYHVWLVFKGASWDKHMLQFGFFLCHVTCSLIHASRCDLAVGAWGPKIFKHSKGGSWSIFWTASVYDPNPFIIQGTYIHDVDKLVNHLPYFSFSWNPPNPTSIKGFSKPSIPTET